MAGRGVGVAGRRVGVGGTGVNVGVSVTAGVGVTVGVSVGVGVGVSTGVGVYVAVGVKVGLGVLVAVGVGVGGPMKDAREQPSKLVITSIAIKRTTAVPATFLPIILKTADLLSPTGQCASLSVQSKAGSGRPPALGIQSAPVEPQ